MHRQPTRCTTPADVMDATLGAVTIGLVPALGALHAGHLALIRRSHAENDDTIVVIFDPDGTPLSLDDTDFQQASEEGARIFYNPAPTTVYPPGFATTVHINGLSDRWEGESQPEAQDRIATLMTILINQLQPTRTYLGEKHLQQLTIVKRLHTDLSLSGEIVTCPIVRDPDGLPLSSANATLTPDERNTALAIPAALFAIQQRTLEDETNSAILEAEARTQIAAHPDINLEYLAIVDPETFTPLPEVVTGARAIVAATIGGTRILDNVYLQRGTEHTDR